MPKCQLLAFISMIYRIAESLKSKGAKIRNQYNQVPHPTQDTNGKVTNLQFDIPNESQEVNPFPAGDHKARINKKHEMSVFSILVFMSSLKSYVH